MIDNLFLSISGILGTRITPENFRVKLDEVNASKGITRKDKTKIITEILAYLVENDSKTKKTDRKA
jgi:hypothetical protein